MGISVYECSSLVSISDTGVSFHRYAKVGALPVPREGEK